MLLANESDTLICGACTQLSFKSSKSKRVASSTSHAETLAHVSAIEESCFLQTWLAELKHPRLSALELINLPSQDLVPIIGCIDCKDLHDQLINPGTPTPVNRAQTLYLATLKEHNTQGRVKEFAWVDTRDNISNVLTKFGQNGLLELSEVQQLYAHCSWEPTHPYRYGRSTLCDAAEVQLTIFAEPPPSTKQMKAKEMPGADSSLFF